jgi:serine/threonine protein kinase
MIALEFAEAELFDFISKEGRFAPEICRTLFKQLIESIKFLEERGITHRDLKP